MFLKSITNFEWRITANGESWNWLCLLPSSFFTKGIGNCLATSLPICLWQPSITLIWLLNTSNRLLIHLYQVLSMTFLSIWFFLLIECFCCCCRQLLAGTGSTASLCRQSRSNSRSRDGTGFAIATLWYTGKGILTQPARTHRSQSSITAGGQFTATVRLPGGSSSRSRHTAIAGRNGHLQGANPNRIPRSFQHIFDSNFSC